MAIFHKNISAFICFLFFTVTSTNGSEISVTDNSFPHAIATREVQSNIMGGGAVPANKYLWFAEGLKRDGSWHQCGGSVVTPEYVLTAASCLFNRPVLANYKIGALSIDDTDQNSVQETIEVAKWIQHPNFDGNYINGNDFALVKLKQRVTAAITPVKMDQGALSPSYHSGQ